MLTRKSAVRRYGPLVVARDPGDRLARSSRGAARHGRRARRVLRPSGRSATAPVRRRLAQPHLRSLRHRRSSSPVSAKSWARCASTANRGWSESIDALAATSVASMDSSLPQTKSRRDALLDDRLEEAAEDLQPVPLPDARQAGVIGKRFGQVVAEIPAQAEAVGHDPHAAGARSAGPRRRGSAAA